MTRAQERVMLQLHYAHTTPYEKRTAGTFRFTGRGMARTLAALQRMGLVTYTEYVGWTGTDFEVFATDKGKGEFIE